jgi:exopolysaccharide biosynthesis WecB/TagA/CpsF family protein
MAFITAFAPEASAGLPTARTEHAMRFDGFVISETHSFPPSREGYCWVYITLNAEIALSLPRSPALQALLGSHRARVSVDGQWVWWALRRKYPGRTLAKLSGSDLIHRLAADCARGGQRLLLVGGQAHANERAAEALRAAHPGLDVAGHAPAVYSPGTEGEAAMQSQTLAVIHDFGPDFVVLGLGATKEHRFAAQVAESLDGQVTGLLCFGGAIDLASGTVRRAPAAWQRLGLEGIYRVLQQPSRLGRFFRVLKVLPKLVLKTY